MAKKIKEISLEVISLIINCIRAFYIQKLSNELHMNINKISNNKFLECVVKRSTYNYVQSLKLMHFFPPSNPRDGRTFLTGQAITHVPCNKQITYLLNPKVRMLHKQFRMSNFQMYQWHHRALTYGTVITGTRSPVDSGANQGKRCLIYYRLDSAIVKAH